MSDERDRTNSNGNWGRLKAAIGLVIVGLVVALAVEMSSRLSEGARAVLAGAICTLGLVVTVGLLIIFVRQYHDQR